MEHFAHWAGEERRFALRFGHLLDLEEACGKVGIGEIYLRLGQHRYFARDVYNIIRMGLIGGGTPPSEAKRLVDERFDFVPMVERVELAISILVAVMAGIPADETKAPGDPKKPHDAGAIFASFAKANIPPEDVRAIGYRDFVLMMRAMGGSSVQPPSEEEFADMVARYEARQKAG